LAAYAAYPAPGPFFRERQRENLLLRSLRKYWRFEDRCLAPSATLKGGASQKVAAKLIAEGLVKEIKAKAEAPVWRRDHETGHAYGLKLTAAGIKRTATDREQDVATKRPETSALESLPARTSSSDAVAQASDIGKAAPREGSKLASVIAMLRRSEGATILALTEATGWLPHTTRAAITGVRKRGYSVILERGGEGASVYRLSNPTTEAAPASAEPCEKTSATRREAKAKQAA
jgi:Protein of unknown function (DUF3489)